MTNEREPRSPEKVSSRSFYETASKVLLQQGTYRGDAHYLWDDIKFVKNDGTLEPGSLQLKDYHAWCSEDFIFDETRYGANQKEQLRLLENFQTVLSISVKHKDRKEQEHHYTICWPSRLRKGSTIGEIFDPEEPEMQTEVVVPHDWPKEQPIIIANNMRFVTPGKMDFGKSRIVRPDEDRQLQLLYKKWILL